MSNAVSSDQLDKARRIIVAVTERLRREAGYQQADRQELASLTAERDRLAGEVERLRANNSHWIKQNAQLARNQHTDWEAIAAQNTRLLEAVRLAKGAMEGAEWSAGVSDESWTGHCPICDGCQELGHEQNCSLSAALKAM